MTRYARIVLAVWGLAVCVGAAARGEGIEGAGPVKVLLANALTKPGHADVTVKGTAKIADGTLTAEKRGATVTVGNASWRDYASEFTLRLDPKARGTVEMDVLSPGRRSRNRPAQMRVTLNRDRTGAAITAVPQVCDPEWDAMRTLSHYIHLFQPTRKGWEAALKQDGLSPKGWYGRALHVRIVVGEKWARLWFEHRFVCEVRDPAPPRGGFTVTLSGGDALSGLKVYSTDLGSSLFLPVDLDLYLNNKLAIGGPSGAVTVKGVPFTLAGAGNNDLFLKSACWPEWRQDTSTYYGLYEQGEWFAGDPRRPFFRLPRGDYSAVWLLAVADADKAMSPAMSLRLGQVAPRGSRQWLYVLHDFEATIPRTEQDAGETTVQTLKTPAGPLFLVRVPLGLAMAQDFEDFMTLDLNKQLELAVRQPDPCRYRIRPLGLPSGVHIVGMTTERTPVRLHVSSSEVGNIFNEPQTPWFSARVENQTGRTQAITVRGYATDPGSQTWSVTAPVRLLPYEAQTVPITFGRLPRGYYKLQVTVASGRGPAHLMRETTFALLPEDTRDRSVRAPWGTWSFGGGHTTPSSVEVYGPLLRKLGMRFTLGGTDSGLARYGLRNFASPRAQAPGCSKGIAGYLERYPHGVKRALIFHENAISGAHIMRLPDCILGRSPYQFDEKEQKRFETLWNDATAAAKEVRKNFPDVKLQFGNGQPQLIEEFLRRKWPRELFDKIGNENGAFMRPTEAQPDNVGFSTLWTFRQVMDFYGYKDVPLDVCYEWQYRATNPGNLTEQEQSDYYVRDGLLGLAWRVEFINPGLVTDVGNGYYFSNWGATGFCNRIPECNPKPSFVSFATLTLVLDRATFVKRHETGSTSLYCLEFKGKDGKPIYALWTLRGRRAVAIDLEKAGKAQLTDWMARQTYIAAPTGKLSLEVTTSPCYLAPTTPLRAVSGGASTYEETPPEQHQMISGLDKLERWTIEPGRNVELEVHNFSCPRRKGNFKFAEAEAFDGGGPSIRVAPQYPVPGKPIQPMYAVMALKQPVVLRGQPRQIGLMVNGNSGWGRVIFELTDASGQRWVSIGASQSGQPTRWMADWLPKEELERAQNVKIADWNTNDAWGRSAINFDGWRYVSFPLPGQYAGEGYHWPGNCNWFHDKDGVVHYPLTFRKLIVTLREKVVVIDTMVLPTRPAIYIKELMAGE